MKAITLIQPWATLVALGAKRIETRPWKAAYRGPIAIHASKGFSGAAKAIAESEPFRSALGWPDLVEGRMQEWLDAVAAAMKTLPLGQVIATARIVNCLPVEQIRPFLTPQERAFGDYSDGRFGFLLGDVKLITPVPAKGALSLWEWQGLPERDEIIPSIRESS